MMQPPSSGDHTPHMSRTFSLDDFQRLVADAFSLTASFPSFPTTFERVASRMEDRSYFDDDYDDDDIEQEGLAESASSEYSSMDTYAQSVRVAARRRSSASCIATMQFSAPSPSPSSLIRRRRHASLSAPFPLSPPLSLHSPSLSDDVVHPMSDAAHHHTLSAEDGCSPFPSSSKAAGTGGGFFKAFRTRASHLLMRSPHAIVRPHTENAAVQTDPADENTRPVGDYTFPPRPSTHPQHADDMYALSLISPGQLSTRVSIACVDPLPVTPRSPSSNIKPGRYATSPKAQTKTRDHTSVDAALSRSLLQMGLAQSQPPRRKRTSSVPLEVLCLQSSSSPTKRDGAGNQVSSEAPIEYPILQKSRTRSTSDASVAPLVSPQPPGPPLPSLSMETAVHTWSGGSDWSASLPPAIPPHTRSSPPAYTRLSPLKTAKSLNFPRSLSKHTRDHSGSNFLPSRPVPVIVSSGGLINRSDAIADGNKILSLGLGVEFLGNELSDDCPEPYMNPRPAPAPPTTKGFTESADEEQELKVPDYVFERRGSATSNCTTCSTRSTRTLKERLSAIVPIPSIPHMPSLRSLKLHTRTKLNISSSPATSLPSSTQNRHLTPPKGFTRSDNSNATVGSGSGSISSPSTPRTPGTYHSPLPSPSISHSSSSGTLPSPISPSAVGIGYGYTFGCNARSCGSRSELSLALGMSIGPWSAFSTGTDESEEEARAIGRVLTPEYDPFKRLEMPTLPHQKKVGSIDSEESVVGGEFVIGPAAPKKTEISASHAHTNSRDTIKPLNYERRGGSRLGLVLGERGQRDSSSRSSSDYTFPPIGSSPLAFSTSKSSVASGDTASSFPDSPSLSFVSIAPDLSPISPVSSFSFSFAANA